jgi:hypothetical protein
MTEAVAAGQIGGGETIGRGVDHLDRARRRQVGAETRADLAIESSERTDRDRGHRQLVFLEDDETDATARGGVDAVPAEQLLHRGGVVRLVSPAEILGEDAQAARVPPTPGGDEREAERQPDQRRREATEPRMPEEELQHEGEGR